MAFNLTSAQLQRIKELDGSSDIAACSFESEEEREACFDEVITDLAQRSRQNLRQMAYRTERSEMGALQELMAHRLMSEGFIEVQSPTVISSRSLEKMGIIEGHPLREQIFWIEGGKRCLRPMLAPNLYTIMRSVSRSVDGRFGIFEIGKCYRKESKGAQHLEEFTMLNLVEVRPSDRPEVRMRDIVRHLSIHLQLPFEIVPEDSEVYGSSWDVNVNGMEVASAAFGPHPLDKEFHVDFPWMGIGFGLERLLMARSGTSNIRRHGSSLVYLNATRIDI